MTIIKLGCILFLSITIFSCQDSNQNQLNSDQSNNILSNKSGSYSIDTSKSTITWTGSMLGVYDHFGTITLDQGTITLENGKITDGSFTVDMSTINPQDENYSRERPKNVLTGHLEGEDFFSTLSYPTAKFVISKSQESVVYGNLTIKEIVNSEQITNVKFYKNNGLITMTGKMIFNRQQYGVSFMASNDLVISDDVELNISITTSDSLLNRVD